MHRSTGGRAAKADRAPRSQDRGAPTDPTHNENNRTMTPPRGLLAAIRFFDGISLWSGRITGWLIIPMVLSLVYEVVARYFFNAPTVWAYDMTSFLYGAFFMLGAAYTLLKRATSAPTRSTRAGRRARRGGSTRPATCCSSSPA